MLPWNYSTDFSILFVVVVLSLASRDSYVLSLAGAATSIIFVATKLIFCRDKTHLLSRQKFCLGKHTFVATKDLFCRDKHVSKMILVASPANDTCLLLVCHTGPRAGLNISCSTAPKHPNKHMLMHDLWPTGWQQQCVC